MVSIGRLDEYATLKFYGLHSKVHPLGQKSKLYSYILCPKSILLFSFLGEHLDFLQDFNNLMVPIGTLDEYTTFKFYGLHSKVHPLGQKSKIYGYSGLQKNWTFWQIIK